MLEKLCFGCVQCYVNKVLSILLNIKPVHITQN